MVDHSSSKRCVSIRLRLAVLFYPLIKKISCYYDNNRVINLIGKDPSCREGRCRLESGLTRKPFIVYTDNAYYKVHKGKVAIGKARYLLNIVYLTPRCSNHLFSVITFFF